MKKLLYAGAAACGWFGFSRYLGKIDEQISYEAARGYTGVIRPDTPELDAKIASLTDSPFGVEHSCYINAKPEDVFEFICDFARIKDWMPGLTKTWSDDSKAEVPGGPGAVRSIRAMGGKMTYETVIAKQFPMLNYSASDKSLGGMYTKHLGAQICLPEGEGTRFIWRSYAVDSPNPIMRFASKYIFLIMVGQSVINLQKKFS